jgi:Ca-activated chloride channel homolog
MKRKSRRSLAVVMGLILLTGVAMLIAGHTETSDARLTVPTGAPGSGPEDPIRLDAHLVQDKVLRGSDGIVTLALTLTASAPPYLEDSAQHAVDLVVVLDRSGSMNGRKISDARRAVQQLMGNLSPRDRLALVAYDNTAASLSGLLPMTEDNRHELSAVVSGIQPGGGTNLGGGLEAGLDILAATAPADHQRKLILISDGLANQGVTDPYALGRMAASGLAKDWVVSTVGVGNDFNEHLMTTLADHGAGNYYYLENPAAFASVFEREYRHAAAAAASGVVISVPVQDGVQLVDAGGYPIEVRDGRALFNPGNLRFGQTRTHYLSFKIPTETAHKATIEGLRVQFRSDAGLVVTTLPDTYTVACVESRDDVVASIRKDVWEEKVLQEDFGRLKEAVAEAIRSGDEQRAMQRIQSYRQEKAAVNDVLASPRVAQNLEEDVDALGAYVQETFAGKPEAVVLKQKKNAKALQYEAYQKRRAKK